MSSVVTMWSHPAGLLRSDRAKRPGDSADQPKETITVTRNPNRGRICRRCSCRDAAGAQLGARCPSLAHRGHGRWAFAVDLPAVAGRRVTMRRCGFPSHGAARDALHRVLDCQQAGIHLDDRETVAQYLDG